MSNKILPCVIGLGYIGLPVFVRLNKKNQTIGFDTNNSKVILLNKKKKLYKSALLKKIELYDPFGYYQ